jgi:hypothetical protein
MAIRFEYGKVTDRNGMAPNTIYLDGAVRGPMVNNEKKSYSFDHHDDCVRAFTLATCQQVLTAMELGFDPRWSDIVVNDLDADTMVALWLLLHPERAADKDIKRMVNAIGFVDSHGPVIPGHEVWPLHMALTPRRGVEQTEEMLRQLLEILDRWYETGEEPAPRPSTPAPAFGLSLSGEMIDCGDVADFRDVYGAGCVVGVVAVPGPEETTGYTVGKVSDFVSYDIRAFLKRANEAEGCTDPSKSWGGGSTIGGAPRKDGGLRSSLTRGQVEDLLLAGAGNLHR